VRFAARRSHCRRHSGQPDWGSGPKGEGKLYRISYTDKTAPQPVLIWPGGESETCIEFDRPIDPTQLKNLAKSAVVTEGRYAGAGDRFETLRPGYQTVQNQLAQPRYELEIVSVVLAADGRTLVIRTVPRARAVSYAVALPRIAYGDRPAEQGARSLPQHQTIDLAHDLSGVEASWQSTDRKEQWNGWLPHLDTAVGHAFTTASEMHARLWPLLKKPANYPCARNWTSGRCYARRHSPDRSWISISTRNGHAGFKISQPAGLKAPATVERVNDGEVRIVVTPQRTSGSDSKR
jgi:hypothetical protein